MADEQVKIVRIVIDASKAKDGGADVERALKSIDDRIESLTDSIQGGLGAVAKFFGAFAILSTIQNQMKTLTDAFDRMGSKASSLGTTTNWLQGFEYALASNTVKLDEGYKALERFSRLIGEGAQGSKAAVDVLDRLGLKIYDASGKLRPMTDLFEEASGKIAGAASASERNALAVDAMGKSAQAVIPAFQGIAAGADSMTSAARRAGAFVEQDMVSKFEKLASQSEQTQLKVRALFAEFGAPVVMTGLEGLNSMLGQIIGQLERGKASGKGFWSTILNDSRASGRIGSGPNALRLETPEEQEARRKAELEAELKANAGDPSRQQMVQEDLDRLNRRSILDRQAAGESEETWARRFKLSASDGTTGTTGAYGAKASDGGAGADRYAKRIELLRGEAEAQKMMAEAAKQGAAAVNEQEAAWKAMQQALEVVGDGASRQDPKVKALAAAFKDLNQQIADSKALSAFRLQTEDLVRGNDVLQKRLELVGAAPEVVAREIALLQVRNEIAKSGAKISDEDIKARTTAVEKQELLNQKLQESQRAQELWLQPLKSALSSMQQGLAGMFEQLFTGGITSWQSFVDSMKRIWIRMLAELAAVSVIRPIIAPIIGAGQSIGLVSPGVASQLGYGGGLGGMGGGMFGGGGLFGGGGMSSMGGSSSGWLGSIGNWLRSPIIGANAANNASQLASLTNTSMPWYSNISWGQGIGAAAGAGMGIYSLATANGNTGKTLGGIASLVGAGVSLIPGVGQIAGPIISMLGGLLPGLFGGEEPKLPPLAGANATWTWDRSRGDYGMAGSTQNGGQDITGQYKQAATSMAELYRQVGGVKRGDQVWGVSVWNNERDKSGASYLIDPSGNSIQWGMGSNARDIGASTAMGVAAYNTLMNATDLSSLVRQGLSNSVGNPNASSAPTFEEVAKAVAELRSFEDVLKGLTQSTTSAEQALQAVDNQFAALFDTANRYGLDTSQLTTSKAQQRAKVGEDFVKSLDRQLNPAAAALQDVEDERKALIDSNKYLLANLAGYQDQIVKIEELAAQKRLKATQQLLGGVEDAIKRLTYGDLSNLGDSATLSGTRAAFMATVAQARAGNADAQARVISEGTNLAQLGQRYYASSPEYEAMRQQILAVFRELQIQAGGGAVTTGTAANAGSNAMVQAQSQQIEQLTALVGDLARQNQDLNSKLTQVTDLLQRAATNR